MGNGMMRRGASLCGRCTPILMHSDTLLWCRYFGCPVSTKRQTGGSMEPVSDASRHLFWNHRTAVIHTAHLTASPAVKGVSSPLLLYKQCPVSCFLSWFSCPQPRRKQMSSHRMEITWSLHSLIQHHFSAHKDFYALTKLMSEFSIFIASFHRHFQNVTNSANG